jgi:hypothetical protein
MNSGSLAGWGKVLSNNNNNNLTVNKTDKSSVQGRCLVNNVGMSP